MMKAALFALGFLVLAGSLECNSQPERKLTFTNNLRENFVDLYIFQNGQNFRYLQAGPDTSKTVTIPDGPYTWHVIADNTISGDILIDTTGSISVSGDLECVVDSVATGCRATWK